MLASSTRRATSVTSPTIDLLTVARGLTRGGLGQLAVAILDRLLQRLHARLEPGHHIVRVGVEEAPDALEGLEARPCEGERSEPGERFDAAYASGDPGLLGDEERADFAGGADVRAAAQLGAERAIADGDDPHAVAILLAEERHRAGGDRLLRVADRGSDRLVAENRLVDDLLDARAAPRASPRGSGRSRSAGDQARRATPPA